jgi:uncharacterized cupredoxin-like copper-binding protein
LLVPTIAVIALLAAACGDDDTDTTAATEPSGSGERTVEVRMADIDFDPASIEVAQGDTVTFSFQNTGAVDHDAFIGDAAAQAEHETEMNPDSDMGGEMAGEMAGEMGNHSDSDDDAITVAPGATGELTYTFDRPGRIEIGCHEPGHYDAGMKIQVDVT